MSSLNKPYIYMYMYSQLCYLSSSVGRALGVETRVLWVRVPPEAADFSQEKSLPQVSSNCVVLLCILEGASKFVYHVYIYVQGIIHAGQVVYNSCDDPLES